MLIHLLISISYSIQRFCLCQPDRLVDACSLEKKCHRYFSQSDIIVYNSQTNFSNNLYSNFNSSQKSIKDEDDIKNVNFDSIIFEVFGSQLGTKKNRPISINMLDEMFSNISKLTIYGGESNQAIYMKNMNSLQISFEAQNIQIIFEDENHLNFDKLSLRNSFLKSGNMSTKLTVEAQEVIGSSASLSSDYFSLIKTGKIQVTDKKEQNIDHSNNFGITAPVKIIDTSSHTNIFGRKRAMKIQEDSTTNRFANYYCLATQARLSRAKELSECEAYSVPIQNYYSGRDTSFLNLLAHADEGADLRIYITLSTEADPIRINIPEFVNNQVKISFISANVDSETRMEVKGRSNSSIESIESKNSTLIVSKIDYFSIDSTYFQTYFNVQLYQSPIYISDARYNTTIQSLTTDATSLSQFTGTDLYIKRNMYLSRAVPVTIQGKVFLDENCTVEVNQYASFPIARYNYDKDISTYYLTLSDAIEDQRFNLYFKHNINMLYTEGSATSSAPSLTFAGGKTIRQLKNPLEIRKGCPHINFEINVPETGIIVNYGSGSEREISFPHSSVFIYRNSTASSTDLNLTISDFSSINNNILDNFVLTFIGPFNINVMTPETIPPYLQGVNKRLDGEEDCKALYGGNELPSFTIDSKNKSKIRCYLIGGYNLSLVNLDVQEKLTSVTYDETALMVGLNGSEKLEKFPKITDIIEITTSTNNDIVFNIVTENTPPEKIADFQLNLKGTPKLYFNNSYNTSYNETSGKYFEINDAMKKLTVNHGSNDLLLIGKEIPVPPITIIDPVEGVLFQSDGITFPSATIGPSFNTNNTRYGPTVSVDITSSINFPQNSFLAEKVIIGGSPSSTLTFEYTNPSRVNYTFKDIKVAFSGANNRVDFKGKRLEFQKAQVSKRSTLTIDVDELWTNSIIAVPEDTVASPVIINKSFIVQLSTSGNSRILAAEDTIKQIIFGDDSVTFVNEGDKKSAKFQSADANTQTSITTNQQSKVQLSVEDGAESVPSNLNLNFNGDSANVDFDKSWSGVDIPPTFTTKFTMPSDKVHLSTEMMSIPDVNIEAEDKNAIVTTTHKRKYTKDLAFWIFIGITALVFVVTLILCIVGLTCCRHVEELDISSSAEGNSDIAIGQVDGLPFTQAEIEEREKNKPLIKEERARLIEERKRRMEILRQKKEERKKKLQEKREKRKKLIAEGKIEEEDLPDLDDEEEEEETFEENYFNDDDDLFHNRSQILLAPSDQKKKQKPQPPKKKKYSETSEEFDQAKKKTQLNAASGAAPPPVAPPPKALPQYAQSDDDSGFYSYNDNEPD